MKKVAVITGASSGIGYEATKRLLDLGYRVIGISRGVSYGDFGGKDFKALQADLTCKKDIQNIVKVLRGERVSVLVNSAGFGRFEPHEELSFETICDMVFLNLTAPMLLTNSLLRELKKNDGYLINITSIEAIQASKFAGVYSATKAGIKAFSDALFVESRKTNLSVTTINPDMT